MTQGDDLIYIGGYGNVAALDRVNGREVWRTSLPATGYGYVSLFVDGDLLVAATGGKVFGLDLASGEIRWSNNMTAMGYGVFGLASTRGAAGMDPAWKKQAGS